LVDDRSREKGQPFLKNHSIPWTGWQNREEKTLRRNGKIKRRWGVYPHWTEALIRLQKYSPLKHALIVKACGLCNRPDSWLKKRGTIGGEGKEHSWLEKGELAEDNCFKYPSREVRRKP